MKFLFTCDQGGNPEGVKTDDLDNQGIRKEDLRIWHIIIEI